ncbi:MAG: hypothetical protein M3Q71_17780 [Chloroflexota bacterium]|nr:hypothetical protein [Chloroflexota bacterium]
MVDPVHCLSLLVVLLAPTIFSPAASAAQNAAPGSSTSTLARLAYPDPAAERSGVGVVTNTREQPYELLLARSPQPVLTEQIVELLSGESGDAAPAGSGPSLGNLEPVRGIGWLPPGAPAWTEDDLAPGTIVALCLVPNPETFMPQAGMGMVAVVTVGDDGATPGP